MGGNFWANTAAWTFFCLVLVLSAATTATESSLLQDLGLAVLPDIAKINISLNEYTTMMDAYLQIRKNSPDRTSIPKLITFDIESQDWWNKNGEMVSRLKFPIGRYIQEAEAESAQLKILAPPLPLGSTTVTVQLYQILGTRRRRLIEERTVYLSDSFPKWCDFDVTNSVQSWMNGERNLGLELICLNCQSTVNPLKAAITVLVHDEHQRFRRRSPYEPESRTECRKGKVKGKLKCCRHTMNVTFSELEIPGMESILQPQYYDAGFCQGHCPPNYNSATNHSRIQSLMHQMSRRKSKRSQNSVPRTCCSPSKLQSLDILRVNPSDPRRLMVEKWDNMKVIECACS